MSVKLNNRKINCKNKFTNILLLYLFALFYGCKSNHLSEEGQEIINEYKAEFNCYEIIIGKGVQTEKGKNDIKYINVRFSECSGALNFDSIQNNPTFRMEIIRKLTPNLIKLKEFDGITLEFDYDINSDFGNRSYLYLYDFNMNSYVIKDSMIVNKF
jgi:hypothetical protein